MQQMTAERRLTTEQDIRAMREELAFSRTPEYRSKKQRATIKKAVSGTIYGLLVMLLMVALATILYAKRTGEAPSIFGFYVFSIETPSMDPTLPVGSIIVSKKPDDPAALQVGDVVTFMMTNGQRVTHRIVERALDEDGKFCYRTKGDNPVNSVDLEALTPDRVVAVMLFEVPLF